MHSILKVVELILALLGVYFIVLRVIAHIVFKELENRARKSEPSPKHIIVENCPICDSSTIDIFENFDTNNEGEQVLVGYSIGCVYCGLRSPVFNSMEQCLDYWNTRKGKNNTEWIPGGAEVVYQEEVTNGKKTG